MPESKGQFESNVIKNLELVIWLVATKLALQYHLIEKYHNPPIQFLIRTQETKKRNLCVCV